MVVLDPVPPCIPLLSIEIADMVSVIPYGGHCISRELSLSLYFQVAYHSLLVTRSAPALRPASPSIIKCPLDTGWV